MDFIVLSALTGCALLRLLITYDIACQWSRNLVARMKSYPGVMRLDPESVEIQTAVPTFHIHVHGPSCQQAFVLAFMLYTGRTAREEVETGWAHMNVVSASIQEMAPGLRHESLNDHWGGWNFQKTVTFSEFCFLLSLDNTN
jgi:Kyakuja-Dileera-Zisupton transposase